MPAELCNTLLPVLHTEPPEPTASEDAKKVWRAFKEATAKQRSLSSKKLALHVKADKAKETWQQLCTDCQNLQEELDEHQKVVEEIGKQYEEKVIKANVLEPPVPGWATSESMRRQVAEAAERGRQQAHDQVRAAQDELQQQVAELQAAMAGMQQQQVPEVHRTELEKLLSGEDSKRRRVAQQEERLNTFKSVKLFFANVTSWSAKVRMCLESMKGVVLWAVVEHGLRGSKLEDERVWLHQRGWKCTAVTSTTEGKAVGGAAVLTRSDAVEATGGFAGGAGYSFVSTFVWLEGVEVLVVSLYLKSGEHLESVTNKPLLTELASSLRMLKVPWMVLADWNQPPSVLKEHWFLEAVKGELVVTNSATIASGNELDYVVVSKHLYGAVETSVEHAVPWAPHYGVNVVLNMRLRQWRVPDARLNSKYADFMHQFESWTYSVATDIPEDDLGRGEVWKDGKVGYWQSLHRWIVEVTMLKQDRKSVAHKLTLWKKIREAADKLSKYWRPLENGVSMVSLQFGLRTVLDLSGEMLDNVLKTVEAVGKLELEQVLAAQKQRLDEWKEKEKATAGTARLAHRYLKKPSELPERPFDKVKFDERPGKRREYWVNLWGEAELKQELSPHRAELKARAIEQAKELKPISSAQIKQTLMHVPNKKEGIDGITFQDLKEMPDGALRDLTWFYHEIEATGQWPQNVQHAVGENEAISGGQVGEMSGSLKTEQISLLADLEHFYDCINVDVLVIKGLALRFPPLLLHHSVIFHEGPRILCADGMASQPIRPARGLVAGDPFSVYLAKVQLHDILHSLYFDYYRVPRMVTSWVDDLGVDVFHFDEEQVVQEACEVSELLAQRLEAEGLRMSIKKTGFLCSSARLAKKLKAALAQRNSRVKVEVVLKDLGLDCTLGRRRIVKQQRARRQKGTLHGLAHATQECACGAIHQDPDDMFHHWLWECPLVLKALGHPAPDWYLHHRKPEQWCFWHFRVVPLEWTSLPTLLEEVECSGIFAEAWPVELEPGVILATDGSGGPFSSNPRKRQCACAVVAVVCRDDEFVEVGSLVANVAGGCAQQTVPRAEAFALQLALEATTSRHGLTIAVDAKYVVQRFRAHDSFVPLNCRNADVWGRIHVRRSQHEHVQLSKIKSHLSREVFVEQFGTDNLLQWFGNQKADAYATARDVVLAQNAKPHYVYTGWLDRRTEAVCDWLWKATKFHLQNKQQLVRKPCGPRKATRAELVRDSQMLSPTHFWTHDAEGDCQCFWCKLRLKRLDSCAALRAKLEMPCVCPGGRVSLPVLISLGVHRSHSFQIRGQQLFCEQCRRQRPVHRLGVFRSCCPKEGRRR
ncbi:PRY3 [Symbiodinium sp. CCMP2592]|nr:PRY3 [Symbiodinium sp. CCMP2592]